MSAALLAPASPAAAAAPACQVSYAMDSEVIGRALITITNIGDEALDGWTLRFTLPAGQTLLRGWNATFAEENGDVTARNLAHNGYVEAGESVYPRLRVTGTDLVSTPTSFTINDLPCTS